MRSLQLRPAGSFFPLLSLACLIDRLFVVDRHRPVNCTTRPLPLFHPLGLEKK